LSFSWLYLLPNKKASIRDGGLRDELLGLISPIPSAGLFLVKKTHLGDLSFFISQGVAEVKKKDTGIKYAYV